MSSPPNAVRGKLGAAPLPGSTRVLQRARNGDGVTGIGGDPAEWRVVDCSQTLCPHADNGTVNRAPYIPSLLLAVNSQVGLLAGGPRWPSPVPRRLRNPACRPLAIASTLVLAGLSPVSLTAEPPLHPPPSIPRRVPPYLHPAASVLLFIVQPGGPAVVLPGG